MNKKFLDKFKICDEEMLLEFFILYSRLEYALKRTGFLKSTDNAQADWDDFISNIKDKFDKNKNEKLEKAVKYLLEYPAKKQVTNGKLDFVSCPTTSSGSDIIRLRHCIRITRNNLFHGGKYSQGSVEGAERNKELLENSIVVIKEFIRLNRKVNNAFGNME